MATVNQSDDSSGDDFLSMGLLFSLASLRRHKKPTRRRKATLPYVLRRKSLGAFHTLVQELAEEDQSTLRKFIRMTGETFDALLHLLAPKLQRQDTNVKQCIAPEERLAVTLHFLATGGTKQNLFFLFRLPISTLQYIVKETCEIIYETLQETQLKFPSSEVEWAAIQQLFLQKWNFPQCLGALDGKHIRIKCPPKGGSMYFNYMHFHSIVLLALVDADYKFVFVDVGAPGRFGDATIWNHSALKEHLEGETLNAPAAMLLPENDVPIPSLIVADAAFALSARVMKPFPDRNMTREERIFNYRLSRARRVVENAFGILAARFGVLQSAMSTHPDTVVKTVQACVVLHNFLRRMGDSKYTGAGMVDTERGPNHELLHGEWRHNASAQLPGLQPVVGGSRHGPTFDDGKAVRNALKNYFVHQGALHWQGMIV